ncbi:hypothetical protein C8T65DRAFT_742124 [Cerioporus squamosus]|nr:hypothetical protein C8T65DRAFT_742124 [Cerioporus squamosus]
MAETEPDTLNQVQDGTANGANVVKQDEEFWLDDSGLLVIIAGGVRFRVLRSVLIKHSTAFADAFTFPQPAEGSHCEDGCLMVELPESAADVRHMLRGLMPHSFLPSAPTYEMVSSCVRMGHKYGIDRLSEQGLAFLQEHFTTDFDEWYSSGFVPANFALKHAIGVVNLARLTETDSLLPTALLACRMLDDEAILGFKDEDGAMVRLRPDDLLRIWKAKDLLYPEINAMVRSALGPIHVPDCWVGDRCIRAAETVLLQYFGLTPTLAVPTHPFFPYEEFKESFLRDPLCDTCDERRRTHLMDEQRKLWMRLPVIFDITVQDWPVWQDDETS